jgi:hypothetical protein
VAKDFDATLSEAIDLAAGAAQGPGATAARIRGGRRTRRKRVALSATSFMLVAAVSTAAFALSSSNRGATPQPPAATTSTPPTTAPTSTPATVPSSPDEPATNTPPTSTSGTSGTSTGTSSTSSAPTNTSSTSPDSPTAPSPTWLTPGQVPFDNLMKWSTATPVHCTGSMVFNDNYPGNCQTHSSPGKAHTARGLDVFVFHSVGVPAGNGAWASPTADQDFFTYANATDAQAAFQSVTQRLLAEDAEFAGAIDITTNRPIVSTTTVTAQSAGSIAIDHKFRDDKGAPSEVVGVYSSYSDVHFYFVVKDNILEVLEIGGGVSISTTSNDEAILATVAGALN